MEREMRPGETPPEEPLFEEDPPEEMPPEENRRSLSPLLLILLTLIFAVVLCIIVWFMFIRPRLGAGGGPSAFANGPYTVDESQPLTFDGSGSSGSNLSYSWDFGDGNSAQDVSPTYIYPDGPAQFDVSLTVTDDQGNMATHTTQVMVNNQPPTANAGGPYTCEVNQTVQLMGQCDDPSPLDRPDLSCVWADIAGAATSQPAYTCPATPGEVTLTLTATDKDGASTQASAILTITEPDGTDGIVTPTTPSDGTTPTITPTTPSDGATPTITPTTPSDGATPTATPTTPAGENRSPTAEIEVHLRSKNGLIYGFDGSQSTDPDGDIVSYQWDFGDGATGEGVEIIHEYEDLGPHNVTLTVTDNQNAQGSATVEVP
jgi:hypothetical protein